MFTQTIWKIRVSNIILNIFITTLISATASYVRDEYGEPLYQHAMLWATINFVKIVLHGELLIHPTIESSVTLLSSLKGNNNAAARTQTYISSEMQYRYMIESSLNQTQAQNYVKTE